MRIKLLFLHIYGSIHQIFSWLYIPWFKYSQKTYVNMKNNCASMGFVLIIWLAIIPFLPIDSIASDWISEGGYQVRTISFLLLVLMSYLDYSIFYQTPLYDKYSYTFKSVSMPYKIAIYLIDLLIFVALVGNLIYHRPSMSSDQSYDRYGHVMKEAPLPQWNYGDTQLKTLGEALPPPHFQAEAAPISFALLRLGVNLPRLSAHQRR